MRSAKEAIDKSKFFDSWTQNNVQLSLMMEPITVKELLEKQLFKEVEYNTSQDHFDFLYLDGLDCTNESVRLGWTTDRASIHIKPIAKTDLVIWVYRPDSMKWNKNIVVIKIDNVKDDETVYYRKVVFNDIKEVMLVLDDVYNAIIDMSVKDSK